MPDYFLFLGINMQHRSDPNIISIVPRKFGLDIVLNTTKWAAVLVKAGRSQVYYGLGLSSTSSGPMREATWLTITKSIVGHLYENATYCVCIVVTQPCEQCSVNTKSTFHMVFSIT